MYLFNYLFCRWKLGQDGKAVLEFAPAKSQNSLEWAILGVRKIQKSKFNACR